MSTRTTSTPNRKSTCLICFRESMIEERVASVMFEIEIDDTLRQLSEGVR